MINLFNTYNTAIDTGDFSHHLHGKNVTELESAIAEYVGAPLAVSTNSATSAIYLVAKWLSHYGAVSVKIPSVMPIVVPNTLIHAGCAVELTDDTSWVGGRYTMGFRNGETWLPCIVDSAQEIARDQFKNYRDFIGIFSFYPTKPLGGIDGGMIVTSLPEAASWLRKATFNGTSSQESSWERRVEFPGWKMYMNSFQAEIIRRRLQTFDEELAKLDYVNGLYSAHFGLPKTASNHLYLLYVEDGNAVRAAARNSGIICGKHYTPCHKMPVYAEYAKLEQYPDSEKHDIHTISIPYHSGLTEQEANDVIKFVKPYIIR
ncbi:MAG: DegT/DnrJ/EryC1/StrS family aminotransferase [Candidatus Thorarchaeota archaeon]